MPKYLPSCLSSTYNVQIFVFDLHVCITKLCYCMSYGRVWSWSGLCSAFHPTLFELWIIPKAIRYFILYNLYCNSLRSFINKRGWILLILFIPFRQIMLKIPSLQSNFAILQLQNEFCSLFKP